MHYLSGCRNGTAGRSILGHALDGEADSVAFFVHVQDHDLDDITDLEGLAGVVQAARGDLGDVDQAVLVDADIHEGTEIDDVADGTGEDHALLQVLDLQNILAQDGLGQVFTGVAAGLLQFFGDIQQGGDAHLTGGGQLFHAKLLHARIQLPEVLGHILGGVAAVFQQIPCGGVGLRVDAGAVENVGTLGDAQEARALLEGLGADLGDFLDLGAGGEGAVLLAIGHDVFRCGGRQAGDPAQEAGRGGVQVHAHGVDAVLHHRVQGGGELLLGAVVLILAHADGLGVDLHQLRQGILETAGDGHGASEVHVEIGEFLGGQLGGGVDRRARLVDDGVGGIGEAFQQLHGHGLGLPGGGAVADGDVTDLMTAHEPGEDLDGLLLFPLGEGGVDHGGVQDLAGGVHHGDLTAVAVAGVQAHGHGALHRGLHQQGTQVQGEIADGTLARPVRQLGADLPADGGLDEPVEGVLGGLSDEGAGIFAVQGRVADQGGADACGDGGSGLQEALLFAPVHGEDLVVLEPGDGGIEIIVEPVDGVGVRVCGGAGETAPAVVEGAELLADGGIVAEVLGDDVGGTGQGLFDGGHALVGGQIGIGQLLGRAAVLGENGGGQGFQALLPGHGAPGTALGLEGAVEVLHLGQSLGVFDGGGEGGGQLALGLNGPQDLLPPLLQAPQVGEPGLQGAQGGVVHGTVELLAVAGDEGDGVALVQQGDDIFNVGELLVQLRRQDFGNGGHGVAPFGWFGD